MQSTISRTDFDGAQTIVYEWSLRDECGEPLRYPIQMVSRTIFGTLEDVEEIEDAW